MEQLFTVDNMASQTILDTLCGHLSLEDLLTLEKVNHLARTAVAAHHYQQLVTLDRENDPELTAVLIDRKNGKSLAGPVITRAAIELSYGQQALWDTLSAHNSKVPKLWHWMLVTIKRRAAHFKELHLKLDSFLDDGDLLLDDEILDEQDDDFFFQIPEDHFQAMNLHAESLLSRVTFSRCTRLKIQFVIIAHNHQLIVMPEFLKHFPALEELVLSGERLPRISSLPAPHRLKKLDLSIEDCDGQLLVSELTICNFSGLEWFSFLSDTPLSEEIIESDTFHKICRLTGVDWMESFRRHPPTRLQHIALPCLAEWSLSLLVRCTALSALTCRSLVLDNLSLVDPLNALQDLSLMSRDAGLFLRNVTHLKTLNSYQTDQEVVNQFIAFTPSLTSLELNIFSNALLRDKPFDANLPLRHLAQLVLVAPLRRKNVIYSSAVTPDWIKTVQRNASPAGLKIKIRFENLDSGKVEEEEVPDQ